VFEHEAGYDGVFYHLAAHDPLLSRGFQKYADNPRLRWRRILLPAVAHLAALGSDRYIHAAYIAANLLLTGLGSFWLARYCASNGLNPAWGIGFLAVPAVLVSMDRLTIDTALSALTVGFALRCDAGWNPRWLAVLALCPLARETGLCLTAGAAAVRLRAGNLKAAFAAAATALPFLAWAFYVASRTPFDGTPWLSVPFAGIVRRTLNPVQYSLTGPWVTLAAGLDYLALLGIWGALVLAVRLALKRRFGTLEASIYAFAFALLWLGKADIWAGAYEFGRTMSPLLVLVALVGIRDRDPWALAPLACVLPRILLQLEPQLRGILA
jgi:hypothetical protein